MIAAFATLLIRTRNLFGNRGPNEWELSDSIEVTLLPQGDKLLVSLLVSPLALPQSCLIVCLSECLSSLLGIAVGALNRERIYWPARSRSRTSVLGAPDAFWLILSEAGGLGGSGGRSEWEWR